MSPVVFKQHYCNAYQCHLLFLSNTTAMHTSATCCFKQHYFNAYQCHLLFLSNTTAIHANVTCCFKQHYFNQSILFTLIYLYVHICTANFHKFRYDIFPKPCFNVYYVLVYGLCHNFPPFLTQFIWFLF